MNWLTKALASSVGKKYVMGVTGLFLCFFLVVHLGGNLLLYVGADTYNHYASALHGNPAFLVTSEVILYLAFAAHIYLAFVTTQENRAARGQQYAMKQTKLEGRRVIIAGLSPDSTMFITGAIVLLFILVHLSDFKFEQFWGTKLDGQLPYPKAGIILADMSRKLIYAVGSLFLGVHVSHGLASAFQSLGINHPKYNNCIKSVSMVFAIVVAVGFASFVLWQPQGTGTAVSSPAVHP